MYYIIFSLVLALLAWMVFGLKNYIAPIVVFVLAAFVNYFALPTLAWWNGELWLEIFFVLFFCIGIKLMIDGEDGSIKKNTIFSCCVFGGSFIAALLIVIAGSKMCNAEHYQTMLDVQEVKYENFASDVNIIPVEKMLVADADLARKVVEDRLEENPGLGSRCYVGKMTLQNLTAEFTIDGGKQLKFENDLVWVAPLEHSSFWKWVTNDVTPGYMLVYANDPTKSYIITEVNGEKLKLRFIESGVFDDDIERHIRYNGYVAHGITEHNFEIDPNGRPYWVLCSYEPTCMATAFDANGVVTVDIQNGDVKAYSIAEAPAWIDHIQPEEFMTEQVISWGELKRGFWNSVFAQQDVQEPTPGMVLVYSEGQSFWYTGIRSAGGDTATSGFMLINTRTKEARYYRVAGVNELEAQRIAEDQNFAKAASYSATSPVLYNVRGIPTYFMTFKGQSGNVTGYAFMAVTNRQAVGVGSSKKEAENAYLQALRRNVDDTVVDGAVTLETKELTVRAITLEGNTYYILFKEVKGKEFSGSSEFFRELRWTKAGDRVSVSYGEGNSQVVPLDSFDNLNFEF